MQTTRNKERLGDALKGYESQLLCLFTHALADSASPLPNGKQGIESY